MKDRYNSQMQSVGSLLTPVAKEIKAEARKNKALPATADFDDFLRKDDIGYTHPIFLQCFLPTRHTAKNAQIWQTDCGRASMLITAGHLVDPARRNTFKKCVVPAGSKARFVVAYVNDFIQREKTPIVDMGRSLRQAMDRMEIPICGTNGEALEREVENFAASDILLGMWHQDGSAHQMGARVSKAMSFWLEKDPDQGTIWQPELTVSTDYFDAIRDGDRLSPFYWPAMIALKGDVRAMDIHAFLVYRLRNGLARNVVLRDVNLHAMFGKDVAQLDHFWPRFLESLQAALKWYPKARVEIGNDCIVLKNSPPLIPYKKLARIT